jgi:uncharacterized protein YodC (DUF2158 family)
MADKKDWKPGDVVKLASGGPAMTVTSEVYNSPASGKPVVCCEWLDSAGTPYEAYFPPEALVAAKN